MANKKITELNEATSVSGNDWLVIVDVANDETKKVHANQVGGNIPIQDTAPQSPEEDDLWIDTSEPEEMQEAIVNEYSESTNDTYSCDYVNDIIIDTYSTNEVKTNKVWVDGKPIYRKVVFISSFPNNGTDIYQTGLPNNVDFITSLTGIATNPTVGHFFPIPYIGRFNNAVNDIELTILTKSEIRIITQSDRSGLSGYIIIEYTKTS